MSKIFPTQAEANELLQMAKMRVDSTIYPFLVSGETTVIPLTAQNGNVPFILDLWKHGLAIHRVKYQNRAHKAFVLVRLDFGHRHENPDGTQASERHIHIYHEGYLDKIAYPLPYDPFPKSGSYWDFYQIFLNFCNIVLPPLLQRDLELAAQEMYL